MRLARSGGDNTYELLLEYLKDYAQSYSVFIGSVMTGANSARLPTIEELEGYEIDKTAQLT